MSKYLDNNCWNLERGKGMEIRRNKLPRGGVWMRLLNLEFRKSHEELDKSVEELIELAKEIKKEHCKETFEWSEEVLLKSIHRGK